MSDDASVSRWLEGLKAGDDADIQRLWNCYFEKLVRLARAKLPSHNRREFDEEDVALSAFHSFCERAERGLFPQLEDRDDLWRLLSTITARKVIAAVRHGTRQKRGGGRLLGESALMDGNTPHDMGEGIAMLLARDPTPEATAQFADECERLFGELDNPTLKTIALRKLEGQSSQEIGAELGISARTVDRKLHLIRALWEKEKS